MSRIRRQIFVNQADGGEILPFLFFFPCPNVQIWISDKSSYLGGGGGNPINQYLKILFSFLLSWRVIISAFYWHRRSRWPNAGRGDIIQSGVSRWKWIFKPVLIQFQSNPRIKAMGLAASFAVRVASQLGKSVPIRLQLSWNLSNRISVSIGSTTCYDLC